MGAGATLRPSLELGVRHDGGDAETGTGVELGAGVAFTDAASGLGIEAKWRMLVAPAPMSNRGRSCDTSLRRRCGSVILASHDGWLHEQDIPGDATTR